MKSLTSQILAIVPASTIGLSLSEAMEVLGHDRAHTKAAFDALASCGKIIVVKRGQGGRIFAVQSSTGVLACAVCQREFTRKPKSKRRTCSETCHVKLAWRKNRDERLASLRAAGKSPKRVAALAETNRKRWADPAQHEKVSAENRRRWKDPETAAIMAAKIRLNHSKPEMRKFYSDMRKKAWQDPEYAAMVKAKSAASLREQSRRDKLRDLAKQRWADPVFRAKFTAANKARNTPELRAANSARMKARHARRRDLELADEVRT